MLLLSSQESSALCDLLNELEHRGMKPLVEKGVLYVQPKQKLDDELRARIKAHTPELIAVLVIPDVDIQWRVARMLKQLLLLSWPCPVPTLVALIAEPKHKEDCHSCGALLDIGEGDSFICGACSRAKNIALILWMQRPVRSVRVA